MAIKRPDVGRLLTAAEIADRTGVHVATVYRWWRDGLLPLVQLGGSKRSTEDDLARFIEANTYRAPTPRVRPIRKRAR